MELITWFRLTCWHKLAEAVNQYREKGSQVFVESELRGKASDGSQNPRIWRGQDQAGNPGQHRASYEVTARTVKFLAHQRWAASREGNGGPASAGSIGEPPLGGEDDILPF